MAGEDAFQVEGIVAEALPNQTYRVRLSNGHEVCAFIVGQAKQKFAGLAPRDKVTLKLSPYDLSEGRIIAVTKTILL